MSTCDYRKQEQKNNESLDLPEGVPPLRAFYLYLSTSCNLSCRHCWITPRLINGRPDPGDVINVDELRAAIYEAKAMGLSNVKLTGGEPLLHPGFREICQLATRENLKMDMETNGTLLTADMARYINDETSLNFISVSIDSTDPERHDAFRGSAGAFARALKGIDNLVAAGFKNVQIIMSVHRGNRHEIHDVIKLAENHGATSVKLNPVTNCGRGIEMDRRGETLDFHEHLALNDYIFNKLEPMLQNAGTPVDLVHNTPPALMPISEIIRRRGDTSDCGVLGILGILGSGEIALCGIGRNIRELVYGRLGKDSIRDIWLHHPTILKLRRVLDDLSDYPDICRECTMARNCRTGCVARNFLDGNRLVWPDALCREAYNRGMFPLTRQKTSFPVENQQTANQNFV